MANINYRCESYIEEIEHLKKLKILEDDEILKIKKQRYENKFFFYIFTPMIIKMMFQI